MKLIDTAMLWRPHFRALIGARFDAIVINGSSRKFGHKFTDT